MSSAAAFPAGRPRYLSFLPRFLFTADRPKFPYILKAWLLALVPSLILGVLITSIVPGPAEPPVRISEPLFIILAVLVAPPLETLLMVPPLWLLDRFLGAGPAVVANALLWAAFHSIATPVWGLVVWWPFLILSTALLVWRQRGMMTAILLVTSIHMLQNAVAAALPFVLDRFA